MVQFVNIIQYFLKIVYGIVASHKRRKCNQFVKGKGFLEVGTRSLAALTTFRFNTRLFVMMWQPE